MLPKENRICTGSLCVISTGAHSQIICGRVQRKSLTGRKRWIESLKLKGERASSFYSDELKELKCISLIWREYQIGENKEGREEKEKRSGGREKRREGKGKEGKQHRERGEN